MQNVGDEAGQLSETFNGQVQQPWELKLKRWISIETIDTAKARPTFSWNISTIFPGMFFLCYTWKSNIFPRVTMESRTGPFTSSLNSESSSTWTLLLSNLNRIMSLKKTFQKTFSQHRIHMYTVTKSDIWDIYKDIGLVDCDLLTTRRSHTVKVQHLHQVWSEWETLAITRD